jgi:predicted RNA-binding protein YlxR (DUF448 family)
VVDGCVVPDPTATRPGRGAYVCDEACLEQALERRAFGRAFRRSVAVSDETLEWTG